MLSGVTHEDCADLCAGLRHRPRRRRPHSGAEYTLEVSSPGLERKLLRPEDYTRFQGSLVKLQTFTPVNKNRQWQGRLTRFSDGVLTIDLSAVKQKGKGKEEHDGRIDRRYRLLPTSKRRIWSRRFNVTRPSSVSHEPMETVKTTRIIGQQKDE